MRRATAFAPAHITGFFEICDSHRNPALAGSRGAGISIGLGVYSTVAVKRSSRSRVEVRVDGRPASMEVTRRAIEELLRMAGGRYEVVVDQHLEVPVGAGFGSSGAGALSAALALNEALGLGLSKVEAARAAHIAEVSCRTGLGDVSAQLVGGLEVRREPGAPGLGLVERVPVGELSVVCASLGSSETRAMLAEPSMRERINRAGRRALASFLRSPSPESFIELSASFAEEVGFMEGWVKGVAEEAVEAGALGLSVKKRALFALCRPSDAEEVARVIGRRLSGVVVSRVDVRGARLV